MQMKFWLRKLVSSMTLMVGRSRSSGVVKLHYSLPILLSVSMSFWSSLSFADDNIITVQGEGQVSKAPDKLRFRATVVTEVLPHEMDKGITANNQIMEEVFQDLERLGVKETDMQTLNFSVSPLYSRSSDSRRNLYAYEISNALSICIRDMSKVGAILAEVGRAEVHISNFRFEVDDPAPLLSTARSHAMKDARKKAEEYAQAGGFQISREPLTVSAGSRVQARASYDIIAAFVGSPPPSGSSNIVTTALGQITYSANITVVYEILPL